VEIRATGTGMELLIQKCLLCVNITFWIGVDETIKSLDSDVRKGFCEVYYAPAP